MKGDIRFRCHTCGEETIYYARMERHMDAHGGGRIEIVIPVKKS